MPKKNSNQLSIDFTMGCDEPDYSVFDNSNRVWFYRAPLSKDAVTAIFNTICSHKVVAFDIEVGSTFPNDGLCWWLGNKRLLQFGMMNQQGQVDSFVFDLFKVGEETVGFLADGMRKFLSDAKVQKLVHNGKYDFTFCLEWLGHGTRIANVFDTMITSTMLYSGIVYGKAHRTRLSLGACVERELGITMDKSNQLSDWNAKHLSVEQIEYAVKDVEILFPLKDALTPKFITKEQRYCVQVENNFVSTQAKIEVNGFRVDWDKLALSKQAHEEKLAELKTTFLSEYPGEKTSGDGLLARINARYAEEFKKPEYDELFTPTNIDTQEHRAIKLKRSLPQLTTAEKETLKHLDPGIAVLADLAGLEKQLQYIDNMFTNRRNDRIYSSFTQLGLTSLGRSASGAAVGKNKQGNAVHGLNLQNCPKPHKLINKDLSIRNCILVDVISDLAAAHNAICVQASLDTVSIDVTNNGGDIHLFTAAKLAEMQGLGLSFDEMMAIKKDSKHPQYKQVKALRDLSKNVRYGQFNLSGAARLQETAAKGGLIFTLDECKDAIKAWRQVHADIYRYQMNKVKESNEVDLTFDWMPPYARFGAVKSVCGIVHHFPKWEKTDFKTGEGTGKFDTKASDVMSSLWMYTESMVMKKACILVQREFDEHPEWEAKINALLHDEIDAECNPKYREEVAKVVFNSMDNCMKEYVKVIPTTTDDWSDACYVKDKDGNVERPITTWMDK